MEKVVRIGKYWCNQVPLTAASSGVASVELWYRYSMDNSTWSDWMNFGTGTRLDGGWMWQVMPSSYGYYQFYSVATDGARKSLF